MYFCWLTVDPCVGCSTIVHSTYVGDHQRVVSADICIINNIILLLFIIVVIIVIIIILPVEGVKSTALLGPVFLFSSTIWFC